MQDKEKLIKFVIDGMRIKKDNKFFRKAAICSIIFPLIIVVSSLMSNDIMNALDVANILVFFCSFVLSIITFVLSFFPHTVKLYLTKMSIVFFNALIGYNMLQFNYFDKLFGMSIGYLFFAILPILSAMFSYDLLMKRAYIENKSKKSTATKAVLSVGAITAGSRIVSKWMHQNFDRNTILLIINILLLLMNCFLSIGLTMFPRLYFACKLEKEGVDLSQYDPFNEANK